MDETGGVKRKRSLEGQAERKRQKRDEEEGETKSDHEGAAEEGEDDGEGEIVIQERKAQADPVATSIVYAAKPPEDKKSHAAKPSLPVIDNFAKPDLPHRALDVAGAKSHLDDDWNRKHNVPRCDMEFVNTSSSEESLRFNSTEGAIVSAEFAGTEVNDKDKIMKKLMCSGAAGAIKGGMHVKFNLPTVLTSAQDIPDDLTVTILLMLPSKYHLQRMALSCRVWRDAYVRYSFLMPDELPWLLMPSSARPLLHVTTEKMTYQHALGENISQDARFCGSVEGGHVVVSLENIREHMLYDLNSRQTFGLPRTLLFKGEVLNIRVEAAVPHGWPNEDGMCVVAAIVRDADKPSYMAFWQPGKEHWVDAMSAWDNDNPDRAIDILDVMYHTQRHAFIFLSEDLNVHIFKLAFDGNDQYLENYEDLHVEGSWMKLRLMQRGGISRFQFLAQSGADILKITKHLDDDDRTRSLTIVKLDQDFVLSGSETDDEEEEEGGKEEEEGGKDEEEMEEDSKAHRIVFWSRRHPLPGRVVFTGRASSRVFERTDSFCEQILFHEERPDEEQGIPLPAMFDLTDRGMFDRHMAVVTEWPPAGGELLVPVSDMCPSVWWFH